MVAVVLCALLAAGVWFRFFSKQRQLDRSRSLNSITDLHKHTRDRRTYYYRTAPPVNKYIRIHHNIERQHFSGLTRVVRRIVVSDKMSHGYQVMSDATRSPTRPIKVPPTPDDQVIFPSNSGSPLQNNGGSMLPSGATNQGHAAGNNNVTSYVHNQSDTTQKNQNQKRRGHGGGSQIDPFELFKHQIGQKVGFSQWMWRYQQKKQHKT